MDRSENLQRINGGHFDVLVIGGGITGAGIAWDCALRGLSVALLERTDFASGTSGVSSKMVHAGLRYMANDPELVKEASLERRRMLRACAHLTRPLEFYLPVYEDTPEYNTQTLPAVLERYDDLADQDNTAPHRLADPAQVLREIPVLRRTPLMVGSYWDGVMDDARVTLEVIQAAAEAGAAVLNHAGVTAFLKDWKGQVRGVRFRDEAPGGEPAGSAAERSVSAEAIVSAAGVYTDLILRLEAQGGGEQAPAIRPSKGVHLVFKKPVTSGKAVVMPVGANVLYFLVPWLHEYVIMGCTDTDYPVKNYEDLDHVPAAEEDIRYNLEVLERAFPGVFERQDIVACYSGVRPLLRPPAAAARRLSESDTSRAHRIWRTESGLWVIAGGKFTTFRLMAEQMADKIVADLQRRGRMRKAVPCFTASRRYHGAPEFCEYPDGIGGWLEKKSAGLRKSTGLPEDCCLHLCESYGTAADRVAELLRADPPLARHIGPGRPWILAEIRHAVQNEMCLTVTDFLARRTALRFVEHQGLDVVETVAAHMAAYLGWSAATQRRQVEEYREYVRRVWPGPFG